MFFCQACEKAPDKNQSASAALSAMVIPADSAIATGAPRPAASALVSASAESVPPKRFKGTFKARKRKVMPQSTAEDDVWKRDDGKYASGPGDLEMAIDSDSHVTGEVQGPWGVLSISGDVGEQGLYATLSSTEAPKPGNHGAFTGLLRGHIDGSTLEATMRVSSGDAIIAREADAHLTLE